MRSACGAGARLILTDGRSHRRKGDMNIGEAATRSGVSAKMIRYYESIDLIPAVARRESGYRVYSERDVATLRFIRSARRLGFPIDRIRQVLTLWLDGTRATA